MDLVLKALIGAVVVLMISIVSHTKNYYIAGLIPLFPAFALIAHYIVGTERSVMDLKSTILFGALSIIPYFIYLGSLYFFVGRMQLTWALMSATGCWVAGAIGVTLVYRIH